MLTAGKNLNADSQNLTSMIMFTVKTNHTVAVTVTASAVLSAIPDFKKMLCFLDILTSV